MVQEKENYCLCSVIQDIFLSYGISKSQDEIAKNLTPTKNGFRADDDKIKSFVESFGFNYGFYWWNETPFGEPDFLIKEIYENEGFLGIGEHVFRILEYEDPSIIGLDPATEFPKEFNYYDLLNKFKTYDGGLGLIKKLK